MSSLYQEEIDRIRLLLNQLGRGTKKSLGQNFLVNGPKIDFIIERLRSFQPERIVEIGPGLGSLTRRLNDLEKSITTLLELDKDFAQFWREQQFDVREGDALHLNWQDLNLKKAVLLSNLPYQIGARVVVDRSVDPCGIETMILMFQKEVAQRLKAVPQTEDYSLLSVVAQSFWELDLLTELGPNDYYPPPKIASRVLIFRRKSLNINAPEYLKFLKMSFAQKRKLLKKNLSAYKPVQFVEAAMTYLKMNPKARPEELAIKEFQDLFFQLQDQADSKQGGLV